MNYILLSFLYKLYNKYSNININVSDFKSAHLALKYTLGIEKTTLTIRPLI